MTNILDQNAKNLDILRKTKKISEIKKLTIYRFFPFKKLSLSEMIKFRKNDLLLKKQKSKKIRKSKDKKQSRKKEIKLKMIPCLIK